MSNQAASPYNRPIVVLGAGPAGLGAAYWLAKAGRKVIVIEKEPRVGGMGASLRVKDYIVDYGPHTFHLKKSPITQLFEQLSGPDVNKVLRKAKIWLYGKTLSFPLGISEALTRLNPLLSSRIILDYLFQQSFGRLKSNGKHILNSFEDWGIHEFGHTLYRLAFGDYSEKMWGMPGSQLSAKLAKQKLTGISLWKMILSTLGLIDKGQAEAMGLNKETLYDAYPVYGIGTFFDALADQVRRMGGIVELSAFPEKMDIANGRVTGIEYIVGGERRKALCDALISSIPLPDLSALLPGDCFTEVQDSAKSIKYRSLIVVNLVLDKENFSDAHWTYLLDPRLMSNRLSEQKHLSKNSCPAGQTVVTFDITCNHGDYLWNADDGFLIGLAIHDLSIMGLHPRTILDAFVLRADNVYPVYSLGFEHHMDTIMGHLEFVSNLFSIGRHGLLLNNDMHDSIELGFFAAQAILESKPSSAWYEIAQRYVHDRLEGIVRDPIKFQQ